MTFYFYDLETTGFNSHEGRIMQFGGQRTDLKLKPIGKPDNVYIKITQDVLPDPYAVLVTGITPQKTLADGVNEADFTRFFNEKVAQPKTIFVGYNNVRFDDEFMRHLMYRNFYDPYEWQWQDEKSKWDLLDVTRMMRALRPKGIKWPFEPGGAPSNQLGLLTAINKLDHSSAHDALSDVKATIALAKLIHTKQPKLFDYLLSMRNKSAIAKLVQAGRPFIYTSGKYPSEFEKTTVVLSIGDHPKRQAVIVYDLRYDPTSFAELTPAELAKAWQRRDPAEGIILPVKTLQFNRCPAVAPLNTLDSDSGQRLKLNMDVVNSNALKLSKIKHWPKRLIEALEILDKQQQERFFSDEHDVDNQLYDSFFDGRDKQSMRLVRAAQPEELGKLAPSLKDKRLKALLPLYKARNYPNYLTQEEKTAWESYRSQRLAAGGQDSRLTKYFSSIDVLSKQPHITKEQKFILEDLKLYGESLLAG